jgi:putative acetyltransferase
MIRIERTSPDNPEFISLVEELDAELAVIDGEEHAFYSVFNTLAGIKKVVVVFLDGIPVACGAMKHFSPEAAEIKRMYVKQSFRNRGIASALLAELELWARESGYSECILETGIRQPDAIALYTKNGYCRIPNWGQYVGVENSVCFKKLL